MDSRDIARLAGVSRSTVSRVINNNPNVSPATRKKVLYIIEEYGYVPDSSARALVGKKNKIIGLFIVNAKGNDSRGIFSSTYYSPFTAAVIDKANELGYHILVSLLNGHNEFEEARKLLRNKAICGGIFVGAEDSSTHIADLVKSGYNLAIVDQTPVVDFEDSTQSVVINSDNLVGGYLATKHLLDSGCQRVAHITGDLSKLSGKQRYQGYSRALSEAKHYLDDDLVVAGDFSEQSGYLAAKSLLRGFNPDAIFCANDSMAIGAIKAIKEEGKLIPNDVAVIGYDDIDAARYLGLSTIRASIFEMASVTVLKLIDIVEKDNKGVECYTVRCELKVRDTSN